jgi:hypothetical protein
MITLLRLESVGNTSRRITNPEMSDVEMLTSLPDEWVGYAESETTDHWFLGLYIDHGKYHLGISHQDDCAFFARNANNAEGEKEVAIAWTLVRPSEVLEDKDTVKRCLIEFFQKSKPGMACFGAK